MKVAAWRRTQSGQDDVGGPALADWPEDLGQEGVGAHGDHAGLVQVGAGRLVQVKQLLQLLDGLQRKAPLRNLEQEVQNGAESRL